MRRGSARGQSTVELAIVLPLLLLLFAGVWTAADLISNVNTAGQATRTGARLGAQVGNNGYRASNIMANCQATGANDPCAVDQAIVVAMRPILQRMPNAVVQEIDVYRPQLCAAGDTFPQCPPNNGAYQSGDLINRYKLDGSLAAPNPQYTLDYRTQVHPTEASIGVAVRFHYTSPTMSLFTKDVTEYTVIRLAPQFS